MFLSSKAKLPPASDLFEKRMIKQNKQASSGPGREETRKLEAEKTSQLEVGLAETRKREREKREREREREKERELRGK